MREHRYGKLQRMIRSALRRMRSVSRRLRGKPSIDFVDSGSYWDDRYAVGGDSGVGSYGKFARFKARTINDFVEKNEIESVVEFGCGDGNQLSLARYPKYIGYDVSENAIALCRKRFENDEDKRFVLLTEQEGGGERAELCLSLDVIYHLVEDDVFESHMAMLFDAADRFVIVYSSNFDEEERAQGVHVRQRRFSNWIEANRPHWVLVEHVKNEHPYEGDYRTGSFADFYVYGREPTKNESRRG